MAVHTFTQGGGVGFCVTVRYFPAAYDRVCNISLLVLSTSYSIAGRNDAPLQVEMFLYSLGEHPREISLP